MAAILAIASAIFYGAADFIGGLASRGWSTIAVVAISQAAGLLVLVVLLAWLPSEPTTEDLLLGVAAGLSGSVGVALLYRALAIGTMGIVAPTTAVCAVVIPVAVGIAFGERPAARVAIGIVLAIMAIALVSQQPSGADVRAVRPRAVPSGLGLALLSGIAIGVFYLALARTTAGAGLWPLVTARGTSIAVFGPLAIARGGLRMPRRTAGMALAGGILDMLANALYLVAVREGPLAVVVTLASLYPASTVVLARVVLGERVSRLQTIGIALALIAVALIVS